MDESTGEPTRRKSVWILAAILVAGGVFRLILALLIWPSVDESYVVAMSRRLALSYYDHPPMMFWLTGAATRLAGKRASARGPAAVPARLRRDHGPRVPARRAPVRALGRTLGRRIPQPDAVLRGLRGGLDSPRRTAAARGGRGRRRASPTRSSTTRARHQGRGTASASAPAWRCSPSTTAWCCWPERDCSS